MSTVTEHPVEIKPRVTLWVKISPVALGIHSRQLVALSPKKQAAAIRAAAAQLARVADELDAKP
jgi:hypothetical protein